MTTTVSIHKYIFDNFLSKKLFKGFNIGIININANGRIIIQANRKSKRTPIQNAFSNSLYGPVIVL